MLEEEKNAKVHHSFISVSRNDEKKKPDLFGFTFELTKKLMNLYIIKN